MEPAYWTGTYVCRAPAVLCLLCTLLPTVKRSTWSYLSGRCLDGVFCCFFWRTAASGGASKPPLALQGAARCPVGTLRGVVRSTPHPDPAIPLRMVPVGTVSGRCECGRLRNTVVEGAVRPRLLADIGGPTRRRRRHTPNIVEGWGRCGPRGMPSTAPVLSRRVVC